MGADSHNNGIASANSMGFSKTSANPAIDISQHTPNVVQLLLPGKLILKSYTLGANYVALCQVHCNFQGKSPYPGAGIPTELSSWA